MIESRKHFTDLHFNEKLMKRFWKCLKGYKVGLTYSEILNTYFSGKSKAKAEQHRRISNLYLNLPIDYTSQI
jgi:hypothetical protein